VAADSGIRHDKTTSGVFSIGWADARHGVAAGGDYKADQDGTRAISWTADGGRTWNPMNGRGYRSAVLWVPARKVWIAVGTPGSDISDDGGKTWKRIDDSSFNALGLARDGRVWAVGSDGRIAHLSEFSQ
jgi:hypothetical protein